ncbi:MAG: aldo/keto reductase [Ignavibacteria bacterium]|jgi:diketogulonate reductase-like aldo/keto reductase|nr:aldo/keto reductase [Ignavibacteria bacterium]MCU7504285.1 aldo/keto reductase [Ignavibacteria bacterium]MCU7516130.1 aldo/keto reductase [Ignavibacteria bacterium]
MIERKIPSTGEMMPVIGLGSWLQFDVGSSPAEREPLREVLRKMAELGGKMIDSSPMYGKSEKVIGDLTNELGIADSFFYATKVWTSGEKPGIEQMESSLRKMRRSTMDLIEVHNLLDWKTHMRTLNKWKKEGRVRYIGLTHYTSSAHEKLESIIKSEKIDFVQLNYSIGDRNAEGSLLNTAREKGVAVIVNVPFDQDGLFRKVKGKKLPDWAGDYEIKSWGQFFLKFIISHPAVTCVIPGTSDPEHLIDNMAAGTGNLPDAKARYEMVSYFERL